MKPCHPSSPESGFTLIEVMLAAAIASMVLLVAWDWFASSMRGVAHNEETLQGLTELQKMITLLKKDLESITPSGPVDLYWRPSNAQMDRPVHRFEEIVWNDTTLGKSLPRDTQPTRVEYVFAGRQDGKAQFEVNMETDPLFEDHEVIRRGMATKFQGSFAAYDIEAEDPDSEEDGLFQVREIWIHASLPVLWRHYKTDDNRPLQYLRRYTLDREAKEMVLSHTFGLNEHSNGIIESFDVTFNRETSYYRDPKDFSNTIHEHIRFFFGVKLLIRGERQGFGPQGRALPFSMSVTPLLQNQEGFRDVRIQ